MGFAVRLATHFAGFMTAVFGLYALFAHDFAAGALLGALGAFLMALTTFAPD